MHFVYFIHEDNDLNVFKIGKTSNHPGERLDQIQTGNPRKLRLYKWIEVDNSITVEEYLHIVFATNHIFGEWYKVTPDMIDAECKTIMEINPTVNVSKNWESYTQTDYLTIKLRKKK